MQQCEAKKWKWSHESYIMQQEHFREPNGSACYGIVGDGDESEAAVEY